MAKMRALIERYEKWLMIGLVVFLCVIFTATGDIQDAFMGGDQPVVGANDVVGSFYVVPDKKVEITNARYAQARLALRVFQDVRRGPSAEDVPVLDVWSHLILSEAARHEGIYTSDRDLVDTMKTINIGLAQLMAQPDAYGEWVKTRYRISKRQFEEAFREAWTALRVRELYIDSYSLAPPATRTELVERYAPGSFEYVDASWASLDAARFSDAVEKEFEAAEDKDALLKEFFETDPAVKSDTINFRHNRRFSFEILNTVHSRLTEENLKRLETMFFKAWPEFAPENNEGKNTLEMWPKGDDKQYWNTYKDRLLEAEKSSVDALRIKAIQQIEEEDRLAAEKETEENKDGEPKDGEPKDEDGGDEPKDDEAKDPEKDDTVDPALAAVRDARIKEAQDAIGFDLLRPRIYRELRLRRLYRHMHNDAFKNASESLEKIYEKLAQLDDKEDPLLSKTPGEGLVVFRKFEDPLTRQEIEDLTDGDARFGPNVAYRVSMAAREKLPAVRATAEILGDAAHGRMSLRVTGLERERRKTFVELSDGEKVILADEYYRPYQARERAKAALGELKKACDEGKVKPDGFRAAAEAIGARVYEEEQITAASRFMAEPDEKLLFPSELQRMRDRHFLRRHLSSLLAADRIKPENERIKPGTWLDVEVRNSMEADAVDPGTAYLILMLDRKKPTATTMPAENMERAEDLAARQTLGRDMDRWNRQYKQLFNDFNLSFESTMKTQIEAAFERLADAERDRANAAASGQ